MAVRRAMARPLTGRIQSRVLSDGSLAFDVKIRNDWSSPGFVDT